MALIKSTHNVAVGSTEAGTVERMLYLKDLSTEARKARQVKANENFQRWRLRKKENKIICTGCGCITGENGMLRI
jgi:3-hydroxyisobutyrate dehydrogenase-like beta-hydroxyacid dehydrogenase